MGNQVKVTSTDALESFRASLIIFLTKSRNSLDEACDDVRRTRVWIQNDQRLHWEREARTRRRALDQAQQDLMSARLSDLRSTILIRQAAVTKAKRAVEEAEDKLRRIKHWNQNFDNCADPLAKRLESLRHFLDDEIPDAIASLVQSLRTLEAYAGTAVPTATSAPAVETETAEQP